MLVKQIPGILPALTLPESLETTHIYSSSREWLLPPGGSLMAEGACF